MCVCVCVCLRMGARACVIALTLCKSLPSNSSPFLQMWRMSRTSILPTALIFCAASSPTESQRRRDSVMRRSHSTTALRLIFAVSCANLDGVRSRRTPSTIFVDGLASCVSIAACTMNGKRLPWPKFRVLILKRNSLPSVRTGPLSDVPKLLWYMANSCRRLSSVPPEFAFT